MSENRMLVALSVAVTDDHEIIERVSVEEHNGRDRFHIESTLTPEKALQRASVYLEAARVLQATGGH